MNEETKKEFPIGTIVRTNYIINEQIRPRTGFGIIRKHLNEKKVLLEWYLNTHEKIGKVELYTSRLKKLLHKPKKLVIKNKIKTNTMGEIAQEAYTLIKTVHEQQENETIRNEYYGGLPKLYEFINEYKITEKTKKISITYNKENITFFILKTSNTQATIIYYLHKKFDEYSFTSTQLYKLRTLGIDCTMRILTRCHDKIRITDAMLKKLQDETYVQQKIKENVRLKKFMLNNYASAFVNEFIVSLIQETQQKIKVPWENIPELLKIKHKEKIKEIKQTKKYMLITTNQLRVTLYASIPDVYLEIGSYTIKAYKEKIHLSTIKRNEGLIRPIGTILPFIPVSEMAEQDFKFAYISNVCFGTLNKQINTAINVNDIHYILTTLLTLLDQPTRDTSGPHYSWETLFLLDGKQEYKEKLKNYNKLPKDNQYRQMVEKYYERKKQKTITTQTNFEEREQRRREEEEQHIPTTVQDMFTIMETNL